MGGGAGGVYVCVWGYVCMGGGGGACVRACINIY